MIGASNLYRVRPRFGRTLFGLQPELCRRPLFAATKLNRLVELTHAMDAIW